MNIDDSDCYLDTSVMEEMAMARTVIDDGSLDDTLQRHAIHSGREILRQRRQDYKRRTYEALHHRHARVKAPRLDPDTFEYLMAFIGVDNFLIIHDD